MLTLDQLFYRDFKKMMAVRSNSPHDISLQVLAEGIETNVEKNLGYIKGIKEPFYDKLNKHTCTLIFKTKVGKPQVLSDGTYRLDANGKEVLDHIPVPRECVLIRSTVNIGLRKKLADGSLYEQNEHFMYIRYKDTVKDGERVRYFYYIVPREYVYRLNVNAVVITKSKRKNYYNGLRIALQDGSYVYIYTVPLKSVRDDTVVLYTGARTDFGAEMMSIYHYWIGKRYAFYYVDCEVDLPDKGEFNLAYSYTGSTLFPEDYVPYTSTLKAEQDITVIE